MQEMHCKPPPPLSLLLSRFIYFFLSPLFFFLLIIALLLFLLLLLVFLLLFSVLFFLILVFLLVLNFLLFLANHSNRCRVLGLVDLILAVGAIGLATALSFRNGLLMGKGLLFLDTDHSFLFLVACLLIWFDALHGGHGDRG
ncbi:hypothetical protein OIU79_008765 [Salix purpurea]|uniref:Transmembrane protein n=1 Tax=Salix purpurea TaxID=77065 RepID=A0A9Q0TJ75_SALPP|nr:hypothetical protein OIU79_008765 [Salix purpurea]